MSLCLCVIMHVIRNNKVSLLENLQEILSISFPPAPSGTTLVCPTSLPLSFVCVCVCGVLLVMLK